MPGPGMVLIGIQQSAVDVKNEMADHVKRKSRPKGRPIDSILI
jgi:hypothetical protein